MTARRTGCRAWRGPSATRTCCSRRTPWDRCGWRRLCGRTSLPRCTDGAGPRKRRGSDTSWRTKVGSGWRAGCGTRACASSTRTSPRTTTCARGATTISRRLSAGATSTRRWSASKRFIIWCGWGISGIGASSGCRIARLARGWIETRPRRACGTPSRRSGASSTSKRGCGISRRISSPTRGSAGTPSSGSRRKPRARTHADVQGAA